MQAPQVLPAAFLAQAVVSFSFAATQLGWIASDQTHPVALGVLVILLPLQLLATIEGIVAGQVGAATGTGLIGALWAADAVSVLTNPPGVVTAGAGMLLLCGGVALALAALIGSFRTLAAAVVAVAALRFAASGVYELAVTSTWHTIAGWVGIALAAVSVAVAMVVGIAGPTSD